MVQGLRLCYQCKGASLILVKELYPTCKSLHDATKDLSLHDATKDPVQPNK